MSQARVVRPLAAAASILCLAVVAIVVPSRPANSQQEIQPVEIVNTPLPVEAPAPLKVDITGVPVIDLDGVPTVQVAPPEPFQASRRGILFSNEAEVSESFLVPEGKMLVIEYFTARTELSRGHRAIFSLSIQTNGSYTTHQMVSFGQGRFDGPTVFGDVFASSELTRFYADSGSEVFMNATRSSTATTGVLVFVTWTISGYLVDV
jgi:hypothetical protein